MRNLNLRKILILVGCLVLVLTFSLVGCFGGNVDCTCTEECQPDCACECGGTEAVFMEDKETVVVAVLGSNAALANIGIDLTKDYLETINKTAEFNEIHDRDVLAGLVSGDVDIAISFLPRTDERELMWLPIVDHDSEQFYVVARRADTEFINGFTQFITQYHQDGNLESLARQHMANHSEFMDALRTPFRFRR